MERVPPHTPLTRLTLAATCLIVAPIAGLLAANAATNPPGEGPGTLQVLLGVLVPASVSYVTVRHAAKRSRIAAVAWALASLVATGLLLLALAVFVDVVVRPA
jgi:hypothetical protein